jgi:hypothetical protein
MPIPIKRKGPLAGPFLKIGFLFYKEIPAIYFFTASLRPFPALNAGTLVSGS